MTPFNTLKDILSAKDLRGYVRLLLAESRQLNSRSEVDGAYREFIAGKGEAPVLEAARKLAANPVYGESLVSLNRFLDGTISANTSAGDLMDYPPYLMW